MSPKLKTMRTQKQKLRKYCSLLSVIILICLVHVFNSYLIFSYLSLPRLLLICWNTFFTIKLHIYSIYKKKIKILSYDNLPPLTLVPRIKKDSRREWAVSAQGISLQKDVYMIHLLILLKHVTIEDCTDDIKWYEYMYSAQFQRKSSLEEVNMEISIISRKHIVWFKAG